MAAADVLLDSNVLLYALSSAPGERVKQRQAAHLLATEQFGTSYQVLMETWVVATRKMERRVEPEKVAAFLEQILAFPCVQGTPGLYRQAVRLSERYAMHPYDAAIVAAAQELGATRVYSEDMSHGQNYDGVEVINPFRSLD
jgi:predicted nucleic acid-binding protein